MKNKVLIFCLLLSSIAYGQRDTTYKGYSQNKKAITEGFWDKCYAGGDVMLYGGSGGFYFNISPLMGYRPNNKGFSLGVGATYQYMSANYGYSVYKYSLYGIRAFMRQDLFEFLFLHAEYENYFTEGYNYFTNKKEFITIPCANIFIGYKQKFSDFSYYYLMLGYEALGSKNARDYLIYPLYPIVFKAGYIFDIKGK